MSEKGLPSQRVVPSATAEWHVLPMAGGEAGRDALTAAPRYRRNPDIVR